MNFRLRGVVGGPLDGERVAGDPPGVVYRVDTPGGEGLAPYYRSGGSFWFDYATGVVPRGSPAGEALLGMTRGWREVLTEERPYGDLAAPAGRGSGGEGPARWSVRRACGVARPAAGDRFKNRRKRDP